MFDSLVDRIKQDDGPTTKGERIRFFAVVMAICVGLFGGLYLVMQHLEG